MIKLLLSGYKIVKGFMRGYRVLFIVGGVVFSFVLYQWTTIKNTKRKLNNAHQEITQLETFKKSAIEANEVTNESLTACLQINEELTRQGAINQAENYKVIEDINEYANLQDKKILELQSQIKPDTNCSLEHVSSNTIKLLKKANNQD